MKRAPQAGVKSDKISSLSSKLVAVDVRYLHSCKNLRGFIREVLKYMSLQYYANICTGTNEEAHYRGI